MAKAMINAIMVPPSDSGVCARVSAGESSFASRDSLFSKAVGSI